MIGYTTITTAQEPWPSLARVLRDSIERFSAYPLEIVGVNGDVPGLTTRRVDLPAGPNHVWYAKLLALITSDFELGAYIDADAIATRRVDDLISYAMEVEDVPLLPEHPGDPNDYHAIMDAAGVTVRTLHYCHAASFVWAKSCQPFFDEAWHLCKELTDRGIVPTFGDESVMNVLLWKHGATRTLPFYEPGIDQPGALVIHGEKDPRKLRVMLDSL